MNKFLGLLVSAAILASSSLAFAQDKGTGTTTLTGTDITKPTHAEHEAA